jgi:hypothetical protein
MPPLIGMEEGGRDSATVSGILPGSSGRIRTCDQALRSPPSEDRGCRRGRRYEFRRLDRRNRPMSGAPVLGRSGAPDSAQYWACALPSTWRPNGHRSATRAPITLSAKPTVKPMGSGKGSGTRRSSSVVQSGVFGPNPKRARRSPASPGLVSPRDLGVGEVTPTFRPSAQEADARLRRA